MEKFMILTNGRSGSNSLVDILNQHPEVFNYGEVLGSWSKKRKLKPFFFARSEEQYLETVLCDKYFFYITQLFYWLKSPHKYKFKLWSDIKQLGIKDFGINIQRLGLCKWILEQPQLKVIHLYRENQLERYISLYAMKSTGTVLSESEGKGTKITIDCAHLLTTLEVYEEEMQFQVNIAKNISSDRLYSISYADLFETSNRQLLVDELFEFLNLSSQTVLERQKRILPKQISEKVFNYSEVVESLIGTPFEKYL